MSAIEVKVPDIGDFKDVPVIEVFVKPGDSVSPEDSLVTLESDKATMDVPSPAAGVVKEVRVKVGDKVSEGSPVVVLDSDAPSPQPSPASGRGSTAPSPQPSPASGRGSAPGAAAVGVGAAAGGDGAAAVGGGTVAGDDRAAASASAAAATASPLPRAGDGPGVRGGGAAEPPPAPRGEKGLADAPGEGANPTAGVVSTVEVKVPDIGDFTDVPVIEIFVKPGDVVKPEDPIVTLESDKATMDVPSPLAGVVEGVRVAVGDRVSEGSVLVTLSAGTAAREAAGAASASHAGSASAPRPVAPVAAPASARGQNEEDAARLASAAGGETPPGPSSAHAQPKGAAPAAQVVDAASFRAAHASPSVRKFARDLGVDLARVRGTGPKGRILQEDVQAFVKQALASPAPAAAPAAGGVTGGGVLDLLPWPKVDFAKHGPVESKPLSRIRKISGANLARNWVMIPHVTQFDEADVTELEALRVTLNKEHEKSGVKVTMLAFLIKASVAALRKFPDFNASLDGENLVYKQYFNVGFAADTPNGLVVPVLKGADRKGVLEIAQEMADLSKKARDGKLGPAEMQGGCFTISSLGGIGGTAFTPIINAPEIAIMGVSRSAQKPVWDGKAFVPRLMLPLSLSYDHRVIDGAAAARFTSYFAQILADFRRVVL